jgi:hypothetical protein
MNSGMAFTNPGITMIGGAIATIGGFIGKNIIKIFNLIPNFINRCKQNVNRIYY